MKRLSLTVLILLIASCLVAPAAMARKKKHKKKKGDEPPPVGVVQIGDWQCWAPPKWDTLKESEKLVVRQQGYEHVKALIDGKQREGFVIDNEDAVTFFETAFLGRPVLLYDWLFENYDRCKAVAEGKASEEDYHEYLRKIGYKLEANECYRPLIYEVHDYIDIQSEWQLRFHICKGNEVLLEATEEANGKYTVAAKDKLRESTFITALGDPSVPEAGEKGPVPDLPLGALVLKFEAEDGSYTKYYATGYRYEFKAPDHGFISFQVNDDSFYDNKFSNQKGAIDYLGLSIYPAVAEGTSE